MAASKNALSAPATVKPLDATPEEKRAVMMALTARFAAAADEMAAARASIGQAQGQPALLHLDAALGHLEGAGRKG